MKRALLALMLPALCFGSGKLSVQANHFFDFRKVLPQVGIAVREPIGWGIDYDGYFGVGIVPTLESSSYLWATNRHELQKWFGDLGVTTGVALRVAQKNVLEQENALYGRLTWKLWE